MPQCSVLRVNEVEEETLYRNAVSAILLNVQAAHRVTLQDIADKIAVSLGTMSNAANKKATLNAIYLNRIGRVFGTHMLDPYLKLCGGRSVPLEAPDTKDVLPFVQRVGLRIAEARDPESPGGAAETLREQAGYLPDLLALQREIGSLICRIEARKDAT